MTLVEDARPTRAGVDGPWSRVAVLRCGASVLMAAAVGCRCGGDFRCAAICAAFCAANCTYAANGEGAIPLTNSCAWRAETWFSLCRVLCRILCSKLFIRSGLWVHDPLSRAAGNRPIGTMRKGRPIGAPFGNSLGRGDPTEPQISG